MRGAEQKAALKSLSVKFQHFSLLHGGENLDPVALGNMCVFPRISGYEFAVERGCDHRFIKFDFVEKGGERGRGRFVCFAVQNDGHA